MKTAFTQWPLAMVLSAGLLGVRPVSGDSTSPANAANDTTAAPKGSTLAKISGPADAKSLESDILSKIHKTNEQEIHAGELAQSRGQSAEIKQYGLLLVTDHQQADQKVQALAAKQGYTIGEPTKVTAEEKKADEKHKADMAQLQTLNGAEFDKKFASAMLVGHRDTIKDLQTQKAGLAPSSPVNQLIAELLPTLEQHETKAKGLTKKAA